MLKILPYFLFFSIKTYVTRLVMIEHDQIDHHSKAREILDRIDMLFVTIGYVFAMLRKPEFLPSITSHYISAEFKIIITRLVIIVQQ